MASEKITAPDEIKTGLRETAEAFRLWSDASLKYFGDTPLSPMDRKYLALQSSRRAMHLVGPQDPLRTQVADLLSCLRSAGLVAAHDPVAVVVTVRAGDA